MKLFSIILLSHLVPLMAQVRTLCTLTNNIFPMKVDMFAGELGYYTITGCDGTNPDIGIKQGETYTFDQSDRSNYYHPIGFAYQADGAHVPVPELQPDIAPPGVTGCDLTKSCPAPMYFRNGTYLGVYSNNADIQTVTTSSVDFGLDVYEPQFFYPLDQWAALGSFTVKLKFDQDYAKDIFYFCHIHSGMSGVIRMLDTDGEPKSAEYDPVIPEAYYKPTTNELDLSCGTYDIGDSALTVTQAECPGSFVCGTSSLTQKQQDFANCINAMNCKMFKGMTTAIQPTDTDIGALFSYQMIPHHQNAVNMAKALLKVKSFGCDDLTVESNGCAFEILVREIIVVQNFQIQVMQSVLTTLGVVVTDCELDVDSSILS